MSVASLLSIKFKSKKVTLSLYLHSILLPNISDYQIGFFHFFSTLKNSSIVDSISLLPNLLGRENKVTYAPEVSESSINLVLST